MKLDLPRVLAESLAGGHPWVYRDHVPGGFTAPIGTPVELSCGPWRGFALYDAEGAIAFRVFSERQPPDAALIAERVRLAWELREPLRAHCSAFRWVNGEGDGLPGLVVDYYAGFAIVLAYTAGVRRLVEDLTKGLDSAAELKGVALRDLQQPGKLVVLSGRRPPRQLVVEEFGMRLHVDVHEGQKTGLFLDQRDNRRFVERLAAGCRVLNLFSYSGGFSVRAALGGASHVVSVDAAGPALSAARENFSLNGLDPEAHEFIERDASLSLEMLRREGRAFDLTICDPPSFARQHKQVRQALRAYRRVNQLGMAVTWPGGIYCAASCTAQVSPAAFREVLAESAQRAQRRFQIIHEAGHALDHPVLAGHREGRYLKFVAGRILPIS